MLNSCCVFFGHRLKCFWNDRKKSNHFGENVWKYRLMNTAVASFNTTVRQMTEMSQWPKFFSNKITKMTSEKKQKGQFWSKVPVERQLYKKRWRPLNWSIKSSTLRVLCFYFLRTRASRTGMKLGKANTF